MSSSCNILFKTAKSGDTTAEINGTNLHSPYDPVKEAKRFIANAIKGESPSTVLLLGAGMGHISGELMKAFPETKLIPFYYHKDIAQKSSGTRGWHPGLSVSPDEFLRANLCETDLSGLEVLKWPPSANIFPELSGHIEEAVSQVIREISGSFMTTHVMGKLWIKNSFINFLNLESLIPFRSSGRNKFLAGSGPSLSDALPWLSRFRDNLELWALPSALACLKEAGLVPDWIVMTDPGYYSFYHLRAVHTSPARIIMPLSSATGVWRLPLKVAYLSQPQFFERELLAALSTELETPSGSAVFPEIIPRGTVAATALELLLACHKGEIHTAGLDFCYRDIISHAPPNTFRELQELAAGRLSPFYSNAYRRAREYAPLKEGDKRTSRPLETYGGWFNHLPEDKKSRLIKIEGDWKNNFRIKSLPPSALAKLPVCENKRSPSFYSRLPSQKRRAELGSRLLAAWGLKIQEALKAANRFKSGSSAEDAGEFLKGNGLWETAYFLEIEKLNRINRLSKLKKETRDEMIILLKSMEEFFTNLQGMMEIRR